jgi:hypothetical protein
VAGDCVCADAAGDQAEDQRDDGSWSVHQVEAGGQGDGGDDGGGAGQAGEWG